MLLLKDNTDAGPRLTPSLHLGAAGRPAISIPTAPRTPPLSVGGEGQWCESLGHVLSSLARRGSRQTGGEEAGRRAKRKQADGRRGSRQTGGEEAGRRAERKQADGRRGSRQTGGEEAGRRAEGGEEAGRRAERKQADGRRGSRQTGTCCSRIAAWAASPAGHPSARPDHSVRPTEV
ncbi:hypothetical protein CgunFtcFv8_003520 [Champsocephalus gunnari]|uniref:Uncharacterized protein n=1 Tax=Champsocephalus gunnari TaxID=52237 RepID=A0AAN8I5B0_CHAGU|nr:hypothetical protein CgunFtcFv8_003520 [Champsocephalus gunnari]